MCTCQQCRPGKKITAVAGNAGIIRRASGGMTSGGMTRGVMTDGMTMVSGLMCTRQHIIIRMRATMAMTRATLAMTVVVVVSGHFWMMRATMASRILKMLPLGRRHSQSRLSPRMSVLVMTRVHNRGTVADVICHSHTAVADQMLGLVQVLPVGLDLRQLQPSRIQSRQASQPQSRNDHSQHQQRKCHRQHQQRKCHRHHHQ